MGNDLLENNSEATELSNSKERFSIISTWLYLMRQGGCLWQFREMCINKGFPIRPQWTVQFCKFAQSILQESPLHKRFAVNSNKYHNKLMSFLEDRAHRNPQILGYNSQGLRKGLWIRQDLLQLGKETGVLVLPQPGLGSTGIYAFSIFTWFLGFYVQIIQWSQYLWQDPGFSFQQIFRGHVARF